MEKWEFKSVKFETKGFLGGKLELNDFDNRLNELGQQGWELVSTFTTNQGQGYTRDVIGTFKRKISL